MGSGAALVYPDPSSCPVCCWLVGCFEKMEIFFLAAIVPQIFPLFLGHSLLALFLSILISLLDSLGICGREE